MAGSFAEARAQILSLRPAVLRAKAGEVRTFGSQSIAAGTALRASADRLGAQRGAPYQAYDERVTPTAGWLTDLGRPTADTGASLEASAGAAERAQMVLAQQEEALARYGSNPGTTPAAFAAAEAQALATLNTAIGEVTSAYGGVLPPQPTPAPVVVGGGGGDGSAANRTATAVGGSAAAVAAGSGTAAAAFAPGSSAGTKAGAGAAGVGASLGGTATAPGSSGGALGPTSGPFAGFVQDPTTGNLVDPGTGRQVDAGGRFLDPITGQPFGPASPFVTRLEGLDGGVTPFGGVLGGVGGVGVGAGAPGAVAPGVFAGVGSPAGVSPGGLGAPGAGGFGAGGFGLGGLGAAGLGGAALVVGGGAFLARGGAGGAAGAGAGTGFFAGLYGGVVPPSLAGDNPAGAQLRQQAAENLATSAGTAQRYSAIASGQAPGAYLPPMAGGGGGAMGGGGGRARSRSGARMSDESAGVWGGTGGNGSRRDRRRTTSPSSTEVEDEEIWSGGSTVPPRLDG